MIRIRELKEGDLTTRGNGKGLGEQVAEVLSVLSPASYSETEWRATMRFKRMMGEVVLVAFEYGRVVGTATLVMGRKLTHDCGLAGRIEDVAVLPESQGLGVGKALVLAALRMAQARGAYKVVLECREEIEPFYVACGLFRNGSSMRINL